MFLFIYLIFQSCLIALGSPFRVYLCLNYFLHFIVETLSATEVEAGVTSVRWGLGYQRT